MQRFPAKISPPDIEESAATYYYYYYYRWSVMQPVMLLPILTELQEGRGTTIKTLIIFSPFFLASLGSSGGGLVASLNPANASSYIPLSSAHGPEE